MGLMVPPSTFVQQPRQQPLRGTVVAQPFSGGPIACADRAYHLLGVDFDGSGRSGSADSEPVNRLSVTSQRVADPGDLPRCGGHAVPPSGRNRSNRHVRQRSERCGREVQAGRDRRVVRDALAANRSSSSRSAKKLATPHSRPQSSALDAFCSPLVLSLSTSLRASRYGGPP